MSDEEFLDQKIRAGRCACGKMQSADVSPCGDLRRRTATAMGVELVVLGRKYRCNRCGHEENAAATVPVGGQSQ